MRLKKILLIIGAEFGAIVALVLLLLVLAIYEFSSPSRDEVLRITSPSGQMDAVVYELNGGATTSLAYDVEIEDRAPSGITRKVAHTYDSVRNNKNAYGVTPRWVSDEELHIEYYSSRFDEVFSPYNRLSGPSVRVELKLNVNDSSALPLTSRRNSPR